jgi:hypothetical protein
LLSLKELEVYEFLDGLELVELYLVEILNVEERGQVLIVELDVSTVLLEPSNLLTYNQFLEVDITMFNFELLLLSPANIVL